MFDDALCAKIIVIRSIESYGRRRKSKSEQSLNNFLLRTCTIMTKQNTKQNKQKTSKSNRSNNCNMQNKTTKKQNSLMDKQKTKKETKRNEKKDDTHICNK